MCSVLGKWPHRLLLLALLALTAAACSSPSRTLNRFSSKETFYHEKHRENLLISDAELKGARFYLELEVLARPAEFEKSPTGSVVIVPKGTVGKALEVGPNWLRVRFDNGAPGLFFVAQPQPDGGAYGTDSPYWLAVQVDGEPQPIKDQPNKQVHTRGTDWEVLYGWNARLLINRSDLDKFKKRRTLRAR